MARPNVNSDGQKQLDAAQQKFDKFEESIKEMTMDKISSSASPMETEQQTKMSSKEIKQYDAPYIKPIRSINRSQGGKDGAKTYWDEKFRPAHTRDWEYVRCICENKEVIGESIHTWTAEYGCDPAHEWKIPVNKPVWIPRLLARHLANRKYHRLRMEDAPTSVEGGITYHGAMVVDQEVSRLDCRPAGGAF